MYAAFILVLLAISADAGRAKLEKRRAVCHMQPHPTAEQHDVHGTVVFTQKNQEKHLQVEVNLTGFAAEEETSYGFHVHTYGDISSGCGGAGGHFNPFGKTHGAPDDTVRHVGDFGNRAQNKDGTMNLSFKDKIASLYGKSSIIGRAVVIHGGQDDLGKGGNAGSQASGNAGPRIACCVIAYANPEA